MRFKTFNPLVLVLMGTFSFFMPLTTHAQEEGYCGDRALDTATEQCDDGNHINRDGCSAYCQIEDMTPPTIQSVSIAHNATGVPTTTRSITVVFSEPIDVKSLNTVVNVRFEYKANPFPITLTLYDDQKTLLIQIGEDLFPNASHALRIKNIKDLVGNFMTAESITVFETGDLIDHTPPNVVVNPPSGTYGFAQNVEFKPYIGSYTGSDDFLDLTAKIYYTLDGKTPTENSTLYTNPIPIRTPTTLQYFAVDSAKNRTPVLSENYRFDCPEMPNAKKVSPYPSCNILECNYGFVFRGNACVVSLEEADPDDYKANAVSAPLFSSPTPMTITSKPAIYITPEHKGIIPRPLIFKDLKRGMVIQFDRDTKIKDVQGRAFSGYIRPPVNLYLKDFPINYGYSFKTIFEFKAADGRELEFNPPIKITIPYTDVFNPDEGVTLWSFNAKTESYTAYDPATFTFDLQKKTVTVTTPKTGRFFVAQKGVNNNKAIFNDITNHWAKNYIEALYRKGIVKGRDDGVFAPDLPVTRAEFIKIALKAIEADIENPDDITKAPFRDSSLDEWFTPYVKKAKEIGLVSGYKDNTFRPQKLITRAEAIKILISAFKFDLKKTPEKPNITCTFFDDLPSSQWFTPFIDFALKNKLVDGKRNERGILIKAFGPDKPLTRAEMAKIAMKTIELSEEMKKK